jgi:hypothetical protein
MGYVSPFWRKLAKVWVSLAKVVGYNPLVWDFGGDGSPSFRSAFWKIGGGMQIMVVYALCAEVFAVSRRLVWPRDGPQE